MGAGVPGDSHCGHLELIRLTRTWPAEEESLTLRVLRKYTNRRLYDTSKSCYITLEDVKQLVLDSVPFEVQDSKTGKDLTRNILLQIISEQEGESAGMLTNQVLQQLIRFYGDSMQGMMRQYLEQSIATFLAQQDRIREQMESMLDAANPLNMMNKIAGQNMAMWNLFHVSEEEENASAEAQNESPETETRSRTGSQSGAAAKSATDSQSETTSRSKTAARSSSSAGQAGDRSGNSDDGGSDNREPGAGQS